MNANHQTDGGLPTHDLLRLQGGFISLWTIVVISLSIGGIGMFIDKAGYAMNDEPIKITSIGQLADLEDGDYVELTGRLDYDFGILADRVTGDAYTVAPLIGTNFGFWVSSKGGAMPASGDGEITMVGRIVERSGSYWEIGDGRELDLTYQAKKLYSIRVEKGALVLQDGVKPGDDLPFASFAGGVGLLILIGYVIRFVNALRERSVLETPDRPLEHSTA